MQPIKLIILGVLFFIVFSPSLLSSYLTWDDTTHIYENIQVFQPLNLATLKSIFTSFVNDTYIPLTTLSFNLEHKIFGLHSWISHLVNVVGHLAIVYCVFIFIVRLGLGVWTALMAASIFAVHPMHVESIAWATERKDILCALFYMLALIYYQKFLTHSNKSHYYFSIIFALLSILAKPMAVSLPWVLFLMDWYYKKPFNRHYCLLKLPFAIIIFTIASLTFFKLDGDLNLIFPDSMLIFIWSATFYIQKFILPYPLLPLYAPHYPVSILNPSYIFAIGSLLSIGISIWFLRKNKPILFGMAFFLSTIFFFFRVDFADINIVADRFVYLPSLGLCLVMGILLSKAPRYVVVGICLILSIITFNQCYVWMNDTTLWTKILHHEPHNKIAREKFKNILTPKITSPFDVRQFKEDCTTSHECLERGVYSVRFGKFALAFSDFNNAIRLDNRNEEAYINRGNLWQTRGNFAHAHLDFDRAIKLNPHSSALLSKAILLGLEKETANALNFFKKAIATGRDLDRALFERGHFYATLDQCEHAIADFTAAITHRPQYKESYYAKGLCALQVNNFELAASDFNRVIALDPNNADAYGNLCHTNVQLNQLNIALNACNVAIKLFPFEENFYNDRAKAYFLLKIYPKALDDINKVIAINPQNKEAQQIRRQINKLFTAK